jgi:predicted amidohydrolase
VKALKIALAQMSMLKNKEDNYQKTLALMKEAHEKGADLILFPEIQLSPFFPQYEKKDVGAYVDHLDDAYVTGIKEACKKYALYASPNIYVEENGHRYDMSLLIDDQGKVIGKQKMVHIAQANQFCEQDYYTPSEEGFHVYDTKFGKIGIVICFDRHYPESMRTAALKGADLVLIPTANVKDEPGKMFIWEIKVQAFQNSVFAVMCNRVGVEDQMSFSGESLVVSPDGDTLVLGNDQEELLTFDLDLKKARRVRESKPYTNLRRPEFYK